MLKKKIPREYILVIFFTFLFCGLIVRIYKLQVIEGADYANNFQLRTKKEIALKGTRGNIYDRNGELLAGNKLVYTVTLEDSGNYEREKERHLSLNSEIYQILQILKANKESVNNELKISMDRQGNYRFIESGVSLKRFKADVYGKADIGDMSDQQADASADEIMKYLTGTERFCLKGYGGKRYSAKEKKDYSLPDKFSAQEILDITAIRYMLSLNTYQRYIPVVVSKDVSEETVAAIMENQNRLTGTKIEGDNIRVYQGGEAFASILGYTGRISGEELEAGKGAYTHLSVIGKAGVEKYFDDALQGRDGIKEVYVNNVGKTISDEKILEKPLTGDDVYLSIDKDLQIKSYGILEKKLAEILAENIINTKSFDKTGVRDASEIKIPVYDVYYALINNNIIDIYQMSRPSASELEKSISERFETHKDFVLSELERELHTGELPYNQNSEEMKSYEKLIVNQLDIFTETEDKERLEIETKWDNGECSVRDYLEELIEADRIRQEVFRTEETYVTSDQAYALLVAYIIDHIKEIKEFDHLIYRYLLLNDVILPREVCLVLYEQGILDKEQEDYEKLRNDYIYAYDFMLKRIRSLDITPAQLALDPCSASAVLVDTKSGKVLACVSYPGYDNNRLANQLDNDYYQKLYEDKAIPFYNRATQQLSAPGSTFKPITVVAGLEEEAILVNTEIYCDGAFDRVEPELKCWKRSGHGRLTNAAQSLQHSCNDYLCEISYRLGSAGNDKYAEDKALGYLQHYAELFDLNKRSGIELTESEPKVTDQNAIPSAIGQGTNNFATIQLGRYVNTLANGGTSFKLSLIDKINEKKQQAQIESQVELKASTWQTVRSGMELYAQNTEFLKDFTIPVAGKSGTAQESKTRPDHGLFIGYAPADQPEISMAVRIVNGYTSGNAVECGRKILEEYFK